jgi:hypothetical protein
MSRRELSLGRDFHAVPDISAALTEGRNDELAKTSRILLVKSTSLFFLLLFFFFFLSRFDFVAVPLVHPRYRRVFGGQEKERTTPFTRSDMLLSSAEWTRVIVGKVCEGEEEQGGEGG